MCVRARSCECMYACSINVCMHWRVRGGGGSCYTKRIDLHDHDHDQVDTELKINERG